MFDPFINYLRLFRDIPEADAALTRNELHYRKVAEGEYLLQEGRICRDIFFVCKGVLRIVSLNDKGDEVTQYFMKEHQFAVNLHSFHHNTPANDSIQAACDAEVIILPKAGLYNLYERLPYLREMVGDIIQKALLEKIQIRNYYLGDDATTRYRKFLIQQPDIALRVPLSAVASYLGITQQSLSRIRKQIS